MRDVTIRRASLQDIDQLVAWRMETLADVFSDAFDALSAPKVADLRQANKEYYQQEIPVGRHLAVFAEVDGEVAGCGGMCLHREMPSPDNPVGLCAYLMNVYTRPQYRGMGVANAVVGHLVDEAHKRGIAKVYLETTAEARPLYQRLGFVDMADYLKLGKR